MNSEGSHSLGNDPTEDSETESLEDTSDEVAKSLEILSFVSVTNQNDFSESLLHDVQESEFDTLKDTEHNNGLGLTLVINVVDQGSTQWVNENTKDAHEHHVSCSILGFDLDGEQKTKEQSNEGSDDDDCHNSLSGQVETLVVWMGLDHSDHEDEVNHENGFVKLDSDGVVHEIFISNEELKHLADTSGRGRSVIFSILVVTSEDDFFIVIILKNWLDPCLNLEKKRNTNF